MYDAIPGNFARVVRKLGTSLSNRAHHENFRFFPSEDLQKAIYIFQILVNGSGGARPQNLGLTFEGQTHIWGGGVR
jgi:hypothetical protein